MTTILGLSLSRVPAEGAYREARQAMVVHLKERGITNERVLKAMEDVPRHKFVPAGHQPFAYNDDSLPIGERQTISPPYIVAFMTEQLQPLPDDRVLEIGTGSGYQAAVLSRLVKEVHTIEIVEPLAVSAAKRLREMGYDNVQVKAGDGYQGWKEHAPFDAIIVTCAPSEVPQPLVDQLKEGGRMIIPVGERYIQTLYLLKKLDGKIEKHSTIPVYFVPMTGQAEEKATVE
ncbi:MAG: protein-L-isoaspartate O-methyltransferase [Armatimonadetes bacterium CG2_30_59_28]|nr:MAG: protein-L-isoaspartate O-methyltransferase [Armatimonadetes bacterium CG2_30_59_28]